MENSITNLANNLFTIELLKTVWDFFLGNAHKFMMIINFQTMIVLRLIQRIKNNPKESQKMLEVFHEQSKFFLKDFDTLMGFFKDDLNG